MESLNSAQCKALLAAARHTLEVYLDFGKTPEPDRSDEALWEPAGAFVTLHKVHELRGCIGTFDTSRPLMLTVQEMAVAAATRDPRFPSVVADEMQEIELEISVLTPPRPGRPEEVKVGVHGIQISRGPHRGVLLPQVATDQNWDAETFLDHTCIKAGLPTVAWKEPQTRIELFTAQVFNEGDFSL